ncbi:MAG: DUF952 domain-containing protein [Halocynthiibacter sp.]
MLIYKIFRASEWAAFDATGTTLGAPVDLADGFIHFSDGSQVAQTAAKHFDRVGDLMLAAFESDAMGADLRWDISRGGARFPHLYRALGRAEVLWSAELPLGPAGHIFPAGVL